jgi:hypothetical protein
MITPLPSETTPSPGRSAGTSLDSVRKTRVPPIETTLGRAFSTACTVVVAGLVGGATTGFPSFSAEINGNDIINNNIVKGASLLTVMNSPGLSGEMKPLPSEQTLT